MHEFYNPMKKRKDLRNNHKEVPEKFKIKASDRTYQIWERNALSTSSWNQAVFEQKPEYIHNNPVAAANAVSRKSINIRL
ncbi:MAG: hypothetical protein JWQ40_1721 [Segetibacter sp.]|nr:hypothetical protein [Segetibacter sp.]